MKDKNSTQTNNCGSKFNEKVLVLCIVGLLCLTFVICFIAVVPKKVGYAEATSAPEIVLKSDNVKVKFVGQLPNGAKPISIWGYFYNGGWHLAVGDDKSNIWSFEW